MRKRFRWDRLLSCLAVVASLAFVMWVLASYVDIVSNNTEEYPVYQTWNLFV
jgi:hypothetical protein